MAARSRMIYKKIVLTAWLIPLAIYAMEGVSPEHARINISAHELTKMILQAYQLQIIDGRMLTSSAEAEQHIINFLNNISGEELNELVDSRTLLEHILAMNLLRFELYKPIIKAILKRGASILPVIRYLYSTACICSFCWKPSSGNNYRFIDATPSFERLPLHEQLTRIEEILVYILVNSCFFNQELETVPKLSTLVVRFLAAQAIAHSAGTSSSLWASLPDSYRVHDKVLRSMGEKKGLPIHITRLPSELITQCSDIIARELSLQYQHSIGTSWFGTQDSRGKDLLIQAHVNHHLMQLQSLLEQFNVDESTQRYLVQHTLLKDVSFDEALQHIRNVPQLALLYRYLDSNSFRSLLTPHLQKRWDEEFRLLANS